jgi:hypothetical protein
MDVEMSVGMKVAGGMVTGEIEKVAIARIMVTEVRDATEFGF